MTAPVMPEVIVPWSVICDYAADESTIISDGFHVICPDEADFARYEQGCYVAVTVHETGDSYTGVVYETDPTNLTIRLLI